MEFFRLRAGTLLKSSLVSISKCKSGHRIVATNPGVEHCDFLPRDTLFVHSLLFFFMHDMY